MADDDSNAYFESFLDSKHGSYGARLGELATGDNTTDLRLLVDLNEIRRFDSKLAVQLMQRPAEFISSWTKVVVGKVEQLSSQPLRQRMTESAISPAPQIHLGFTGNFGSNQLSPRGLRASHLGRLICLEGVVTRCSLSQTKVVRSVHWSATTCKFMTREYSDLSELLTKSGPADMNDPSLEMEYGLSVYKDNQVLTIQESPEWAPLGQLPRSVRETSVTKQF